MSDDIDITRLCATAMELDIKWNGYLLVNQYVHGPGDVRYYAPLTDDAQALALVKRFKVLLHAKPMHGYPQWQVEITNYNGQESVSRAANADLNRAICECVAKMQQAKAGSESAHSLNAQAAAQREIINAAGLGQAPAGTMPRDAESCLAPAAPVCHNITSNAKPCVNMKFIERDSLTNANAYRCAVCGLTEIR